MKLVGKKPRVRLDKQRDEAHAGLGLEVLQAAGRVDPPLQYASASHWPGKPAKQHLLASSWASKSSQRLASPEDSSQADGNLRPTGW